MLETKKFVRTSFDVEAVQVTNENMDLVALWCGGTTHVENNGAMYITVKVRHPLSARQTKAFVGDWVLYNGAGFKVYLPTAFSKSFVASDDRTILHPEVTLAAEPETQLVELMVTTEPAAPSPALLAKQAQNKSVV